MSASIPVISSNLPASLQEVNRRAQLAALSRDTKAVADAGTRNPQLATWNYGAYINDAPASARGLRSPLVKQTCAVIP
jgi:hypothetical protein